jgi:hypothetical protein
MFRLGVVICLISVTAAGPWTCCCTATRLAVRLFTSRASEPASRPSAPPCCCHHEQADETAPSCPTCPDQPHQPGAPSCPCKQAAGDPATFAAAPEPTNGDPLQPALDLLPASLADAVEIAFVSPSLPFWTSGDLIRLCHHLRC